MTLGMFRFFNIRQVAMLFFLLVVFVGVTKWVESLVPIFSLNPKDKHERSECSNGLLAYFNLNDGIDLKFAHAVNSKAKLASALKDSSVLMIEADVLMDILKNIPIMAHPPATSSDLTLDHFLRTVLSCNMAKGIKLDFKQLEAVEPSMKILKSVLADKRFRLKKPVPIMFNADILVGPNQPKQVPVNASEFIKLSALDGFPLNVLSPGWTTAKADSKNSHQGYTWKMVEEMVNVLKHVKGPVTFPIRASLAAQSKHQLLWLLRTSQNYTLTLWHGYMDDYKTSDFAFLRKYPTRVYYDLPTKMTSELRVVSP